METSGDESQRLQDLAADLDMTLPSSGYINPAQPLDTVGEQKHGVVEPPQPLPSTQINLSARPSLRRETSVPAPSLPPPPPPSQPDSLTLTQLRSLVKELPREEVQPYAFTYSDAATLPEEIEEWFSYNTPERANILRAQSCFATEWGGFNNWAFTGDDESPLDWNKTTEERRQKFISRLLDGIQGESAADARLEKLEALVYIVLGCWHETAGLEIGGNMTLEEVSSMLGQPTEIDLDSDTEPDVDSEPAKAERSTKTDAQVRREKALHEQYGKSGFQLQWLKTNTRMLLETQGGLQIIFDAVRRSCEGECSPEAGRNENFATRVELERRETWCALTVFYVCLEVARAEDDEDDRTAYRAKILSLEPNLLLFLGSTMNKLRWDPGISGELQQSAEKGPSTKLLLLLWKSVLVCLGGSDDITVARKSFETEDKKETKHQLKEDTKGPLITASPLEYHTFRQEISSKYPAYNPPPSFFPLDLEQRSLLPPLRNTAAKPQQSYTTNGDAQHGTSILHQPVHIATPAPSPPPSPALGKGGKKQNYQTPHLLPFNYPPLDSTSNQIGGKGAAMELDAMVGRKWEGPDIPFSILEASKLFSGRMRATRALKQLWEERDEFVKYERGWTGADGMEDEVDDVQPLDDNEGVLVGKKEGEESPEQTRRGFNGSTEERLATVERFYSDNLSNLQSIVMLLMKTILANVTSLITQAAGQASVQSGFPTNHFQPDNTNGTSEHLNRPSSDPQADISKLNQDELDKMRGEEISAKAVTGILLLMLKWFKVSHVLKMEYLTQLLVDANYIPMVLKLLQTQEIERVVVWRCESEEWNFFRYCRAHSRIGIPADDPNSPPPPRPESPPSDDDALPPPIKRRRDSPQLQPADASTVPLPSDETQQSQLPSTFPPEVDELGIPTSQMPTEPITNFSWRNFATNINYLRILQKICKNKAHRNLMLITYKSANHLRKALKIPQRELRLYTLKLFKNQVPYCGRKWRQGNMRVITAVYLHVHPNLRDDWLSGSDVDQEVEGSVGAEQSLRALTHWYNLRNYPKGMGAERGVLDEEREFFRRELEGMGYVMVGGVDLGEGDEHAVVGEGVEWGVGQLEGW